MNLRHVSLVILISSTLLFHPACSQTAGQTTNLSGKIALREGWRPRVYLVKPNFYKQLISSYEGTPADSASVAPDGTFSFKNLSWLREKGIYMLFVQPVHSRFYHEIASPPTAENYACLVLAPGEQTRLGANIWEFTRSYQLLDANAESRHKEELRIFVRKYFEQR